MTITPDLALVISDYRRRLGDDAGAVLVADLGRLLKNQTITNAARILNGAGGGRPPRKDRVSLAKVARLVAGGMSVHAACRLVARGLAKAEGASIDSIRRRLQRKFSDSQKKVRTKHFLSDIDAL